ncbi:hypothetical protein [Acinetobacter chinensis]|jgi:PBP1b-binding outer membrane lipoprotein LpoB|uniref:hypothetical protein n=1 Tax=Acinetobacter chinensis TaxID=2004650 RepID=UPI0029350F1D|nr:hypothetical protein [Acinetobacter chinensis]WOE40273.1 hypothetical protein QSG87_10180 [Acinetobacter chinensis]
MKNLKTALIVLVSAASLTLVACGKKQEEQAPAQEQATSEVNETAVSSVEVNPDEIDAAPMLEEYNTPAASEAK